MVIEKRLKKLLGKKMFNSIVYAIGGSIELLGLWFLFNFDGALNFLQEFPISIGILIIGGFLLAVSVRQ